MRPRTTLHQRGCTRGMHAASIFKTPMVLENTYRASRTEALARQNASYVEQLRNQHARAHSTFAQESQQGRINQPRLRIKQRRVLHIKARRNPSGAVAPLRVNGRYRVIEDGPFVDEKAALQLQSMMQGERNRLYHMQPYAVVLSSRIFHENEDGFLGEREEDDDGGGGGGSSGDGDGNSRNL